MNSKAKGTIAWVALIFASVRIFAWNIQPRSYFTMMMRHDPGSSAVIYSRQITDLDDNAKKLAPPKGNMALAFRGYSTANSGDADLAARIFFRFNYILYPQRIYPVTPEDVAVNTGDDLFIPTAPPSSEWLGARDIRTIAVFSKTPGGESFVQPISVPQTP